MRGTSRIKMPAISATMGASEPMVNTMEHLLMLCG
jgi:hypothetical protein